MAEKPKNRDWVKNAAIIFLAVLLVLTFFSNTIMNRSLPEVATQEVTGGSIVARVRGTGTVTANSNTQVKMDRTRVIRSVLVKVGQQVQPGDVLFTLGEGASEEIDAAEEKLQSLQANYNKIAATMPEYSYGADQNRLGHLEEAYNKAVQAEEAARKGAEQSLSNNEQFKKAEAALAAAEAAKAAAEEVYNKAMEDASKYDSKETLKKYLDQQNDILEKLYKNDSNSSPYEIDGFTYGDADSQSNRNLIDQNNYDDYKNDYLDGDEAIDKQIITVEHRINYLISTSPKTGEESEQTLNDVNISSYNDNNDTVEENQEVIEESQEDDISSPEGEDEDNEIEINNISLLGSQFGEDDQQDDLIAGGTTSFGMTTDDATPEGTVSDNTSPNNTNLDETNPVVGANRDSPNSGETNTDTSSGNVIINVNEGGTVNVYNDGTGEDDSESGTGDSGTGTGTETGDVTPTPTTHTELYYRQLQLVVLESALGDYRELQSIIDSLWNDADLIAAREAYENAVLEVEKWSTAYWTYYNKSGTPETEAYKMARQERIYAEESYLSARQTLRDKISNNEKSIAGYNVDLANLWQQIEKAKQKLADLTGGEEAQILAKIAGTIQSIDAAPGDTKKKDDILATIEATDLGYNLSFSVTNEQAARLRPGDEATVSNFYWGSEINAVLNSIKIDQKNPQTNKLLTFDVSGNVTAGTELTLSVGQKSATYDIIIPSSAIRTDANGTFVLKVESKNSPLGNRYLARRVPVEVLASDDSNSAVSADLSNGDYVITTSTSPLKNGELVRLATS